MSQVNLIIAQKSTTNKKISTTITHLRESQTNHAEQLAQALVALTTNEYQGATIQKTSNVTEGQGGKTTPILIVDPFDFSLSPARAEITYNGDGQLLVSCNEPAYIVTEDNNKYLKVRISGTITPITGTIYAMETANYKSATTDFDEPLPD